MSGNSPVEPPPENVEFPSIGQYDIVPGPGEEGYVAPEPEPEPPAPEAIEPDETEGMDDVAELDGDPTLEDADEPGDED